MLHPPDATMGEFGISIMVDKTGMCDFLLQIWISVCVSVWVVGQELGVGCCVLSMMYYSVPKSHAQGDGVTVSVD
jgi:hypothetical protein